jgi:putative pyruvate formate lyase activating enzyme
MDDEASSSYSHLFNSGELAYRVKIAFERLKACDICPRRCNINRLDDVQKGACNTGEHAVVASYGAHFGEERPLVGLYGSGTIFFSWCNMGCVYCQNADISQRGIGKPVSSSELASMMLSLQTQGCHNINLVSPSHVVPQILAAVLIASKAGLNIPLVYNTGGYDAPETLELLDGVIDIYMPDMKYADSYIGKKLSGVPNYPEINQQAVKMMHHQVGDLELNSKEIAQRGLLIRHLVLPNGLSGSKKIFSFIADNFKNTYVNVMNQYRPCYKANQTNNYPELSRKTSFLEYQGAVHSALKAGLNRLDS